MEESYFYKCCGTSDQQPIKLCPLHNENKEEFSSLLVKTLDKEPQSLFSWSVLPSQLSCSRFIVDTPWHLESDGSLFAENDIYDKDDYCLDVHDHALAPFVCISEDPDYYECSNYNSIGILISLVFYLVNATIYIMSDELRRTTHGKAFINLQLSMLVSYGILAHCVQGMDTDLEFGTVLGYIMQFAFLATFFWMNVMCFDIWWTFSSLKKTGGSVRETDMKKFMLYSLYAWGFPLLILSATLIADLTPLLPPHSTLRPMMGVDKCFFRTGAATWLYMYGPIAILIVANLFMFGFTAKKIFLHTRETKILHNANSKRHDSKDRERFNLYLKLFIVMGVNWVAELVSWAFNSRSAVWYITDITNTLQGVIIFVIFVCKRRVLRLLELSLCPIRAERRRNANSSSRSRNTTTSVVNGSSRSAAAPEAVQLKASNFHDSDSNL